MKPSLVMIMAALVLCTALLTLRVQAAPTATITVNTTADTVADDGKCSLREAITAANTNVAVGGCPAGAVGNAFSGDKIEFAIPGDGPHTIAVQSELPAITSIINIDGLSQSGAKCVNNLPARHGDQSAQRTTLMVALDGSALTTGYGLTFAESAGWSNVQGLVISRFPGNGIEIRSTNTGFGVGVLCNFIGTNNGGTAAAGNGKIGILIENSPSSSIQANIIAGNGAEGILIQGTDAVDNLIVDNYIGTNPDGADLGNSGHGIRAQQTGSQIIGGTYTNQGECCLGNTIAFNGGDGVAVVAQGTISWEKGIRGNRIYANTGLGIDLEDNGVTPNDPGDSDGAGSANQLQNFPVISAAHLITSTITVSGTLNSTANTTFQLDFYANDRCDPSGYGEGERWLGYGSVKTDDKGNGTFAITLTETVPMLARYGNLITAIATDPDSNTSEFSQCLQSTGGEAIWMPLIRR